VRLLWLLPKAAPALLRHMAAYAELAGQDLEQAQRDLGAQLMAAAVFVLGVVFLVFCVFVLVLALSWDTPYRVTAILSMGGAFALLSIIAAVYRSKLASRQAPFLGTLRREWSEDRMLLERILASGEE
jgi:uncharacterized membrane protein YqjE